MKIKLRLYRQHAKWFRKAQGKEVGGMCLIDAVSTD